MMRRQARKWGGGAFVLRTASALQVWLWLLIFVFQNEFRISRSIQPGYLDFDNLPDTNFTCTGKVIGGYYADLETSCQMFHVCTVGQQDEPMDIKFLCLNGTVFDQETRVCERVDEVDCTKSEKFYSLNLELYGSTIPPIIEPESPKPSEQSIHQSEEHNTEGNSDPSIDDVRRPYNENSESHIADPIDSTEDPQSGSHIDIPKVHDKFYPNHSPTVEHMEPIEENQEEDEEDSESPEYEDYTSHTSSTTPSPTITTTTPASSTSRMSPTTFRLPAVITSMSPIVQPQVSTSAPVRTSSNMPTVSSVDPALLSPQEFIYHNRGPGAEAISFQRQGFRPADGVYITHAPPQQFDHFQYESSRTAPRPVISRPSPFALRPTSTPFRGTTLDPRDQLLRPGPSSQPSERYETAVKHRPPYPSIVPLPVQRPIAIDHYYFDRKRSDNSEVNTESSLTARSARPPVVTERQPTKPKSPPRVIVTASASVSDSNGKRLNYTVGNVVSAVKPIVQINYDDYKESDLIFDPFFLDVPKLQKRRKTRAENIVSIPATTIYSIGKSILTTTTIISPVTSKDLENRTSSASSKSTTMVTTTTQWNPNDYVDDNYEPQAYLPPVPPLAYLLSTDEIKKSQDNNNINTKINEEIKVSRLEQFKPTLSVARTQVSSSQSSAASSTVKQLH